MNATVVTRLSQTILLVKRDHSVDSQVPTSSDLREQIVAEFLCESDFFVVNARKTAINSLIPARIMRFHHNAAVAFRLFGNRIHLCRSGQEF